MLLLALGIVPEAGGQESWEKGSACACVCARRVGREGVRVCVCARVCACVRACARWFMCPVSSCPGLLRERECVCVCACVRACARWFMCPVSSCPGLLSGAWRQDLQFWSAPKM
jgi:hypothetical protein